MVASLWTVSLWGGLTQEFDFFANTSSRVFKIGILDDIIRRHTEWENECQETIMDEENMPCDAKPKRRYKKWINFSNVICYHYVETFETNLWRKLVNGQTFHAHRAM